MPLWDDPLDELIAGLDRAVSPARDAFPGHFDVASWRSDLDALCELVMAATARPRDPDRVHHLQVDPRVVRAMENMRPRTG
jgi:hypothetical protein